MKRFVTLFLVAAIVVAAVWLGATREIGAVVGWIAAGLAVALQRVVTSAAGSLIIRRADIFRPGDRITIGGVRGDVAAMGWMQTTVMEMGQPPGEQSDAPSMWVQGRQYTGRVVRVTNDKIFDSPVYNYTREFPYIWEELVVPVRYADSRATVEAILLSAAERHTAEIVAEAEPHLEQLRHVYHIGDRPEVRPRVYVRLTDNWVELTVRFLTRDRDARGIKDKMSREILDALNAAKIGVASGTYAIVEMPTITVRQETTNGS